VDRPIAISVLLSGYVEVSQPATPRNIRTLLQAENSENSTSVLQTLESSYVDAVLSKRLSVLDILEANPDIKISFGTYLEMLPAMRIRQYSISSSPLWNPQHATLTISVLQAPAISGKEEPFMGVASNYLDNLKPGDRVQMAIRQSVAFHLPADPATPVVMFCAGSGLAPMRGFIQERVLQKQGGRDVGKLLLFFGCRSPKDDYLYSDTDIAEWTTSGVLDIRPAFSRYSDESFGCKYVQEYVMCATVRCPDLTCSVVIVVSGRTALTSPRCSTIKPRSASIQF
jgi:cytochrome P450/NADPH-cytochrome P450 reductase